MVAVAGYVTAGWSLGDAIYMVVITIFGVGYGEVQPVQSTGLRTLTISVIIAGYGAVIFTIGGLVQFLIDGELNKALGARRMTKEIDRLNGHTIICGIGRLGTMLARELRESGKSFVAIDMDRERLRDAEESGYLVLHGDATEEKVLEQAGIARASTVATVLSEDALNVFVTITARELNPEITIIARAENPRTEKKLFRSGANQVVLPTAIGANKVAQLIVHPTAENMLEQILSQSNLIGDLGQIGLRFDEMEVQEDSPLVNRAIEEIEIRSNHGFLIVGIRRADGTNRIHPDPLTKLLPHDVVVVLGHNDDIPELASRFKASSRMTYRGVTFEN
jgi:voltage-gated potassium channel